MKSKEPLIILRQREVRGIFFPAPLKSIPLELKKELLITLSSSVKKILDAKGIREEEILEDFEEYRKTCGGR